MNSRENNRMNTFNAVDAVLRAHQESVATIEALNLESLAPPLPLFYRTTADSPDHVTAIRKLIGTAPNSADAPSAPVAPKPNPD